MRHGIFDAALLYNLRNYGSVERVNALYIHMPFKMVFINLRSIQKLHMNLFFIIQT